MSTKIQPYNIDQTADYTVNKVTTSTIVLGGVDLQSHVNAVFSTANSAIETAVYALNSGPSYAFDQANAAFQQANAAYQAASNVAPQVQPSFDKANASYEIATNAFLQANVAFDSVSFAFAKANSAFDAASNVAPQVQPSFDKANASYEIATNAFLQANAAYALAQSGGGASAAAVYTKTYFWKGNLVENVGSLRHYVPVANATISSISSYLGTPGLTQSTATIKKNGTVVNTITFPSGSVANTQSNLSIAITSTDYLTVDITQSSSASDLYINLIYQG